MRYYSTSTTEVGKATNNSSPSPFGQGAPNQSFCTEIIGSTNQNPWFVRFPREKRETSVLHLFYKKFYLQHQTSYEPDGQVTTPTHVLYAIGLDGQFRAHFAEFGVRSVFVRLLVAASRPRPFHVRSFPFSEDSSPNLGLFTYISQLFI